MTAADHYREGERLLALASQGPANDVDLTLTMIAAAHAHFAAAQVGATLAAAQIGAWFARSDTHEMDLYRATLSYDGGVDND